MELTASFIHYDHCKGQFKCLAVFFCSLLMADIQFLFLFNGNLFSIYHIFLFIYFFFAQICFVNALFYCE